MFFQNILYRKSSLFIPFVVVGNDMLTLETYPHYKVLFGLHELCFTLKLLGILDRCTLHLSTSKNHHKERLVMYQQIRQLFLSC